MSNPQVIDINADVYIPVVTLADSLGNPYNAVGGNTYSHIATATTTAVKASPGQLHSISINSKGTVASTVTVYDSLAGSGAVIAVIDSLNLSGTTIFDVNFTIGLTIVTTGTVAPDVTVSYS